MLLDAQGIYEETRRDPLIHWLESQIMPPALLETPLPAWRFWRSHDQR